MKRTQRTCPIEPAGGVIKRAAQLLRFRLAYHTIAQAAPNWMNLPLAESRFDQRLEFEVGVLQDDVGHWAKEEDAREYPTLELGHAQLVRDLAIR